MTKIAIHHAKGRFSERWVTYCKRENIPFKIVNCFDSDIIEQVKDCDALMWHHSGTEFKEVLVANKILFALEHAGVKVFPDFYTNWHFDDKVAQKYLMEAIGAPLAPSYVFYDKKEALNWANNTSYPKVFKLTRGDGSRNVKLVKRKNEAIWFIEKSFGGGISPVDRKGYLKEQYRKYKIGKVGLLGLANGFRRLLIPTEFERLQCREKGYVYFQEFIPNNDFDIRMIIVGDKAFALKRLVRENDFRASGSGSIIYDKDQINIECVKIAFEVNKKIRSQSIAFDFVFDQAKRPLIVEISYGYAVEAYDPCPGYWDSNLNWHEGRFNPQEWMVENLIKGLKQK